MIVPLLAMATSTDQLHTTVILRFLDGHGNISSTTKVDVLNELLLGIHGVIVVVLVGTPYRFSMFWVHITTYKPSTFNILCYAYGVNRHFVEHRQTILELPYWSTSHSDEIRFRNPEIMILWISPVHPPAPSCKSGKWRLIHTDSWSEKCHVNLVVIIESWVGG